jgi:hypothetical protein
VSNTNTALKFILNRINILRDLITL